MQRLLGMLAAAIGGLAVLASKDLAPNKAFSVAQPRASYYSAGEKSGVRAAKRLALKRRNILRDRASKRRAAR